MGVRPPKIHDMFKHTAIDLDKDHDVPIENFLNAQCMYGAPGSYATADKIQISARSLLERLPR